MPAEDIWKAEVWQEMCFSSAGQKMIMGFAVVTLWVPVFSIKGIEKQVTGQSSFVCAYLASKHDFEPVITKNKILNKTASWSRDIKCRLSGDNSSCVFSLFSIFLNKTTQFCSVALSLGDST